MLNLLRGIVKRIKLVYSRPATRGDARFGPSFHTA